MAQDQKELEINKDQDIEEEDDVEQEDQNNVNEQHLGCQIDCGDPQVSLAAMNGLGRLETFKTYGAIKKNRVLIMIDPGSTLNIIDKRTAKKLGLSIDIRESFPISTPEHKQIQCKGLAHQIELQVGYYTLKGPFYITNVGGVDVIIKIQWLISISTYNTNHLEGFLKFQEKGCEYTIKVIPPKENKVVNLEQMNKIL